jgi:hypothetical protein
MNDALLGGHLGDNLIGLIRSDIHLEGGGWLEQFLSSAVLIAFFSSAHRV